MAAEQDRTYQRLLAQSHRRPWERWKIARAPETSSAACWSAVSGWLHLFISSITTEQLQDPEAIRVQPSAFTALWALCKLWDFRSLARMV